MYRAPMGVMQKEFVVHLSTLCQKASSFFVVLESGVKGFLPYVSMGKIAPKTNCLLHQEERPFPAVLRRRTVVKVASARASRFKK